MSTWCEQSRRRPVTMISGRDWARGEMGLIDYSFIYPFVERYLCWSQCREVSEYAERARAIVYRPLSRGGRTSISVRHCLLRPSNPRSTDRTRIDSPIIDTQSNPRRDDDRRPHNQSGTRWDQHSERCSFGGVFTDPR